MEAKYKEAFAYLHENESHLSLNQIDLIKSLEKQFKKTGSLSARQEKILYEIRKYT